LHQQFGSVAGNGGLDSVIPLAPAGPGQARAAQQLVHREGACLSFGTEALPWEGIRPLVQLRDDKLAWMWDGPFDAPFLLHCQPVF